MYARSVAGADDATAIEVSSIAIDDPLIAAAPPAPPCPAFEQWARRRRRRQRGGGSAARRAPPGMPFVRVGVRCRLGRWMAWRPLTCDAVAGGSRDVCFALVGPSQTFGHGLAQAMPQLPSCAIL